MGATKVMRSDFLKVIAKALGFLDISAILSSVTKSGIVWEFEIRSTESMGENAKHMTINGTKYNSLMRIYPDPPVTVK